MRGRQRARAVVISFGQSGSPKPDNFEPYGQNSRPWRSFCNGTAVGGQKPGFETFRNFPISEMPGLFVEGRKKPRLEQSLSSIGPGGLGCLTPGRTIKAAFREGVYIPLSLYFIILATPQVLPSLVQCGKVCA